MGSQSAEATQRNHTIVLRESQYEDHSFSTQPCKPCARRGSIPSNCSGRCGDQASGEGSWPGHNTSGAAYSSQGGGSFRGGSFWSTRRKMAAGNPPQKNQVPPTEVRERGGGWTSQRLARRTSSVSYCNPTPA